MMKKGIPGKRFRNFEPVFEVYKSIKYYSKYVD